MMAAFDGDGRGRLHLEELQSWYLEYVQDQWSNERWPAVCERCAIPPDGVDLGQLRVGLGIAAGHCAGWSKCRAQRVWCS